MKNGIIALLVVIVGILVLREFTPTSSESQRLSQSAAQAPKRDNPNNTQPPSPTAEPAKTMAPPITARSDPPQPLMPENLRIVARSEIQKSVALIYSRYFAKANLPKEKADLLMELLVDQMMVGLEPDVQSANGKQKAPNQNEQLITDLIGNEGAADLAAAKSSYLADQKAQEAITAIFGQQPIPENQRAAILNTFLATILARIVVP